MLSIYWSVFIAGVTYTFLDIRFVHKGYKLQPYDQLVLFMHSLVIMYLFIGLTFPDRYNTMIHFVTSLFVMALWNMNGHCIFSKYMENSVEYTKEDYDMIIMEYPDRLKHHLSVFIPILLIDALKLIYFVD